LEVDQPSHALKRTVRDKAFGAIMRSGPHDRLGIRPTRECHGSHSLDAG
jgi:hypothetical protein